MSISPAEAIRLYDVSKPTLYKDMKEGTISYEQDDKNRRRLNPAELDRVYKKRRLEEGAQTILKGGYNPATETALNAELVPVALMDKILKEQREQFENQIEMLRIALDQAQKLPQLLENSRKEENDKVEEAWEQNIELLKGQVANEKDLRIKELARSKRLYKENKYLKDSLKAQNEEIERSTHGSIFKFFRKGTS